MPYVIIPFFMQRPTSTVQSILGVFSPSDNASILRNAWLFSFVESVEKLENNPNIRIVVVKNVISFIKSFIL